MARTWGKLNKKRVRGRRVHTPTVLQMEAVECGAACLAMILGRYGRFVPLETLRYECGVSRDGTKASNIVKAARVFGLNAKGFSLEPDALRSLAMPVIVFWNFNHFVVVEGFGKGAVYLNDPATGRRAVSEAEFDEAFTGLALTFERGPGFKRGGRRPQVWTGLLKRMSNSWSAFAFVALASVALVVPGLAVPALSRIFVDYVLIQDFREWLVPVLGGMTAAAILRMGLTWLQQRYLLRLQTKLATSNSATFFWHVLRLPISFFAQRYGGEVSNRVALNDRLAQLIAGDLAVAILSVVTMVLYALIMIQYDRLLTAITVVFGLLNLVVFAAVSRHMSEGSQKLLLDEGKLLGVTAQGLQMIESYKASGTENLFFARWAGYHAKVVNSEQALARYRLFLSSSPILLALLGSAVVLVVGGFRVMDGVITIGTLVALQSLMTGFTAPITNLIQLGNLVQEAQGDIVRLDDILAHDSDIEFEARPKLPVMMSPNVRDSASLTAHQSNADAVLHTLATPSVTAPILKLSGRLEIRGLSFGFIPTDPPLVEDFSLNIEPGAQIALVGGSGSGKSTIGKLIAGLLVPWGGEILFDDVPHMQMPRQILRNSLAVVDQDIALFEGTVSDNITLWDSTMPEERVIQAARDAAIHDEINKRAGSYEQLVREGGRNFSGGQRQRIEIARALVADPSILILDEATSALDAAAEKEVIDNIRRRGCTCIIIAHRLSTIRDCDEIIVLDHGKVIERGRHEELILMDGYYRKLIES